MKTGIMLINLGTPEEPTPQSVRAHLSRFLADRRVVDAPHWLWMPILHCFVLRSRPKKSARLYQKIWLEEGSPLLVYTKKQAEKLQAHLPEHVVRYAMQYSRPSVNDVFDEMMAQGVEEIIFLPLYPQFSVTTVGSVYDEVSRCLMKKQNIPRVRFVSSFYQHEDYLASLARRIREKTAEKAYDMIIFSYHGIPASYAEKGDPYPEQCTYTTEKVMKLAGDYPFLQTYQSKFGPHEWLTPATDKTLAELPAQGAKKVLVLTPGFVSDCIETLEEIEEEDRNCFLSSGGEVFDYIHPFNDAEDFAGLLEHIVMDI